MNQNNIIVEKLQNIFKTITSKINNISFLNNEQIQIVDEKEKLFLDLLSELTSNKKNKRWYDSKGECIIRQDIKNKLIWFSYCRIWLRFEKFGLNYYEITELLTYMTEKHLNLKEYTVRKHYYLRSH